MAAFQGVRLRSPGLRVAAEHERRRVLPSSRPTRTRPTTAIMGAILAATMLGLVYLTQTLGSHAATAEIAELEATQQTLSFKLNNQRLKVEFAADPVEVGQAAKRLGLERLEDPITLPAP